ncbi:MAG: helix-turn-helix transcriptional regulator [Peptostreptococcaceae bacterium]
MRLSQNNMKYIYDTVSRIFPLNFNIIYKDGKPVRLVSVKLPEDLKKYEEKMINYLLGEDTIRKKDLVIYFETELRLKYMFFNIYGEDGYEGNLILGPYINHPIHLDIKNEDDIRVDKLIPIISILQEKSIDNIILALINSNIEDQESMVIREQKSKYDNIKDYSTTELDMSVLNVRERYKIESRLLHYISIGDRERAIDTIGDKSLIVGINKFPENPIRSIKNFAIKINILFRKAVQENNIDPYFLDYVSEHFVKKIEDTNNIDMVKFIFKEMINEYCDLVNKYMNEGYSKLISESINYIRLNFKYEMGLSSISKAMFVHPTYLAKKFKFETGKTITEYINETRTKEAKLMLKTTELKVEDIAYYVGYNDKTYFSKVFKKMYGISPSDFRNYK